MLAKRFLANNWKKAPVAGWSKCAVYVTYKKHMEPISRPRLFFSSSHNFLGFFHLASRDIIFRAAPYPPIQDVPTNTAAGRPLHSKKPHCYSVTVCHCGVYHTVLYNCTNSRQISFLSSSEPSINNTYLHTTAALSREQLRRSTRLFTTTASNSSNCYLLPPSKANFGFGTSYPSLFYFFPKANWDFNNSLHLELLCIPTPHH
ncbi:hypothetical protein V8F20_006782 [Naviculisporaceae sp. PSN 640]